MDSNKSKAAIIITLMLVPLVYLVVWEVLSGQFSNDLKAMVAGAIVGSMLTAITGFWLGGTHGDKTNDTPPSP